MDYVKLLRDELDQHKLKSAEGSGGSGNREESNIIAKLDEIIKNNHPRETTVEQPKKTNGNFSLTSDREKERQTVQQQSATDRALQEAVTQKNNALAVNDNLSYEEKLSNLRGQKHQAKKDKISAAIDSILGQVTVDEGRINQAQQDYNAASQRLKDSKTALADLKKNKWDETQKYNQNQLEQNAELKSLVAMAYKAKLNADMAQTTKANLYPGNAAAAQTGLDPASVANSQAVSDYNSYFKKIEEMGYDANSLLDTYTRNSNKQLTEKIEEKTNDFADKHPVIASGAHVALNAFQAPAMEDIVRTGLQSAISDEYIPIDTNAPTFAATNVRDAISGQVTGDIQQKVIDKTDNETLANAAGFLYQTGLSIGDFASVAALPQPASLAIMGTSAAVSTAKDATERGISADKAALTAIAAGASEIIFEKLSLENLNALKATGRSGVENTVKDILKQTFTEGSEEVFTDIANAISDQIINGDNSAIMQNYRKFIDEGMSEGEARKQTAISFGKQIGESFLGGAISGGIMGAGGVAYGNIAQTNYYRAVGNEIKQNGTAQDVINTGLNTDTQSKTYQAAMELQSRLERSSYDNNSESADYSVLSSKKLGQLQLANENLGSQTNLINAVADSNQAPLTAVSKFAAGEKLNSKDVSAIKNSDVAIDAINQEYGTNLTSDNISKFELNQLSDTVSKNVAYPFKRNYTAESTSSYNIPATDKFGKPVDITDISVEQGNVVVTTAENEKINSNDLNFQNSETTELFERAAVYPTNAAKSFIAGYDYSSEQSVRDYAIGFSDIYIDTARSGATANMTAETAIAMGTDKNLAPQQAFLAYSAAVNEFKGGNKGKSKAVKNNGNIKAQFDAALKSNTVGTTVIGTPKTSMQNAEIALLDEVAKNNNLSVIVVDSVQDVMNEDSNAAAVNDKIVIGLDTQNGMLLPYAGHELFHILKQNKNSSATAKELQSFIIDVLKNDASYNYGERFNELQSAYKFKGTDAEITDMINEEIAANACFTVLSNEKNFNSLVKQNKSLAQRVYDFFADFLNQIKERLVTLAKQNKEYKALHNEYKIQDKIVSMMKTALGEYQKNNTATNDSVASTGIKFSKKISDYPYNMQTVIKDYLNSTDSKILNFINKFNADKKFNRLFVSKANSRQIADIKNLLNIDVSKFSNSINTNAIEHIENRHGKDGKADHSMRNDNDIARMGYILSEYDSIELLVDENGNQIFSKEFKTKDNSQAPMVLYKKKINGTYYLVESVVDGKYKRLWVSTAYINKKDTVTQVSDSSITAPKFYAQDELASSVSNNNISQTDTDVNNNSMQNNSKYSLRDSDGNELTEQQQEYFKDSKVRDENGNLLVMYHGTPNEFTVFKNKGDGSYFTPDKEYASGYTQAMNDFDGHVMSVYLNITKPFDINDKKTKDIFINEYIKGGWAQGISPYSTDAEINKYIERGLDWTEGSNLIEFIEENELDYDGLIIDEGSFADGDWEYSGKGANAKWRGYSYVIFNSNQAKNINNTNPTDNEDIRFSLRDSQYEKAVNTNDLETAQKLVDESAVLWGALTDENGNPLRVYHGTTNQEGKSVWNEKTKTFDTSYRKFTVFKNQYDEQTGHFFNSNADNAGGYGSTLYEVYLKMNKPLVINCKNANYSAVSYKGQIKDTYEWAEYAKNNGYDGVIFKNISDGVGYEDLQFPTDDYVVFYSSQIKSAEPVTYDNSGNVISLDKRFSFYQDIRFSLRENNKDVEKLLKENAQLQDANELLRQELQLTKGHRLNQSNIKSIAKSFIKKYGAYELDEQTLYNKLSALYDYMANAGSMIDDRYIWSVANDIAKNIIKVSTVKDTEFYNEYKPLKKRLRETAITVPADVRREVSSYSNIHKLRIRNNGSIALDSFYNELAADYPELFDSSVLSEADQLSRIIEVYESIAPIYTDRLSQSGYTLEEYSSIVAAEIFDKYFNVKEMPTFADKKQQELEQLKLHYSNAIDDMRKQYDKRYNERERQLKEKLKNVNARNQQKLIKQQAHFTEMSLNAFHRKRRTIAKNKIANVKKDLTRRLLNPTETSYVPMSLVQKIADICDLINETQIKDKNNFDRSQNIINELQLLHSAYEELKSYPDVDYASEYEQEMGTNISLLKNALEQSITDGDSGTLQVSQLDYPQLEDIYHILRDIKNALVDATYQIGLDERISNHQRGIKIINELNETKGWRNAHIGRYEMETLNPVRAVRKITEYNDDAELYKLVNELNLGQRKADKFISDASKPFYNLRQQAKEFTRFSSVEVETNIVDKNGNKVKMTENEIVQLIMTMKRRQGKNHLKEKGFILPDRKLLKKGKHKNALAQGVVIERLNPYEVSKMYDNLSDYAKAWVSASQYLFNEQGKNAINETSMLLKHKKIATDENYIPIQVDTDFTSKEIQGLKFDGTIEGMGYLKSVVNKANQPLVIQGLNTVVDKHINDVSKYYGLAIPIRNFNKAFGVQTSEKHDVKLGRNTVRVALRNKWGEYGLKLIDNLISDLQPGGPTRRRNMFDDIFDEMQSGFVQATLASNISVTIKQAASYPTALANLSSKALGKGLPVFGYNTKQFDKLFAEIDEHTGIHFKRRIGMSSQELGELTKENAFINKIPATINPMKWIQAMDVKTTAALWVAAKYDVKKLYPDIKVNSEAYFEKVTSLYEETIENTQPNYDVLHRPEIQKTNGFIRSVVMFKTQPLQNTGILYDSLFEYRKKHSEYNKNKTDENKFALEQAQRKFRKAVISQFLASVTFSAMSMLAAMARHTMYGYRDDDDEVTWKSVVAGLLNSMASLFFTLLAPVGGGELYEFTKSLGDGYTSDFVSVPVVTTINDLCSSINKVVKTANGVVDGENEPKDLLSSVENLGYSVATIFGIPVKNAVNYSKGIVANIKDAVNGEFGKFEAGIDRKPRQNVERYGKYLTGDSYKENPSKAKEILDEMISDKKEALLAAGETAAEAEKEARKSVRNSFSNYYKEQYQEAFSKKDAEKRRQIINILKSTGLFVYETKRTLADVISDWEEETKK